MARVATLKEKNIKTPSMEGLEVNVNEFGEITSTLNIDEMNAFLNKNVFDKKLKNKVASPVASDDYESLDEDFEDDEDDFDDDFDDEDEDFDDEE